MNIQKNKITDRIRISLPAIAIALCGVFSAQAQVRDYRTDDRLSPEVRTYLQGINHDGPGLETLSPSAARKVLEDLQAGVRYDYSGVIESEKTIQQDGYHVKLNIMRPKAAKGQLPVLIFIHGGGWLLGDYPTHKRMVRDLTLGTGYAVVFVNYSRTPEAVYPVAINEVYAATKWVAAHGNTINVDGKRIGVVGNSAGGNMAAVLALLSKERKGPEIKTEVLMWPTVTRDFTANSYQQFSKDRFLTTEVVRWTDDFYVPDPAQRDDIHVAPLKATLAQLKGLPPTLIQIADNDVLMDEGEAYGRKLLEAGVRATTVRYNGVIHDFGLLNGLSEIPQTKDLFIQAAAHLKKYLGH